LLRYFHDLSPAEEQTFFHRPPQPLSRQLARDDLAYALGALLYMPATRADVADSIIWGKWSHLIALVLCLEDAIGDRMVLEAEQVLIGQLRTLGQAIRSGRFAASALPLMFVRVRHVEQLRRLTRQLGEDARWLTGFVFPKFSLADGAAYWEALAELNGELGQTLYGMPILESAAVLEEERRLAELTGIRQLLLEHRELVLNVRIGATDFCSRFGLRRPMGLTIYDLVPVRDCIASILNQFLRVEDPFVVSGPVWEYFAPGPLTQPAMQGLIREVQLDKANGIIGKTVIHPSQLRPVQALYAVTYEEYQDATSILALDNGLVGVAKSPFANKMNEIKPHRSWAEQTMRRARVYGVLHEQQTYEALLAERVYVV